MAVNMNKRECLRNVSFILCLLLGLLECVNSQTTTPISNVTTAVANATDNATAAATTTPATTTTTVPTTTTTTIAPLQPPTSLDSNSLIGQCPCDLTGNACDVNCCCDEDCTTDDKQTFSQCQPFSTDVDDRLCFRNEIILFENSDPVVSEVTDDGLFCIYYDNKEERNFYTDPDQVKTLGVFNEYRQEFRTFSYQSDVVPTVNFASPFYKSGDPIYTVFESLAVGALSLPRTLTSSDCVDGNPAAFLRDESYSCVRSLENSAACAAGSPSLDANTFITGFRVVTSPQMFQEFNTTVPGTNGFYSLFNNSYTIPVELDNTTAVHPIQCIDDATGLTAPCNLNTLPSPTLAAGGATCNFATRQVHYRLVTDGTSGLVRVLARFVLGSVAVSSPGVQFSQSFSSSFEASGTQDTFQRSGKPGYVVGQPVLAGTLNQTTTADSTVDQILISSDRNKYMTMVRSSASGDCISDSDDRISVVFGQNIRTGCLLRVSATNLTEYCALMQQKILETMEYDSVPESTGGDFRDNNRYVALYGDSDVSKTGDWVKVIYQNRHLPTTPSTESSSCKLSLGMHIQVLYANIGALVNPQPKIIGVSYVYDLPKAVQIRPTLSGDYNQPLEVTASVAFIDVSKEAVNYQGEAPIFLAKVPYDFFYPFISGASTPASLLSSCLPLMVAVLKAAHQCL